MRYLDQQSITLIFPELFQNPMLYNHICGITSHQLLTVDGLTLSKLQLSVTIKNVYGNVDLMMNSLCLEGNIDTDLDKSNACSSKVI